MSARRVRVIGALLVIGAAWSRSVRAQQLPGQVITGRDVAILGGGVRFRSFSYRSFPSMHAMASFAAATALSEEMRLHEARYRGVVSPVLYLAASMSPAARMYLDEHWASDIALGAFLGIFAGQKVVNYSHAHPRNPVDHFLLKREVNVGVSLHAGRFSPLVSVSSF